MLAYLIILFLLLPFIDLFVLIELSSQIGFWNTLALVIVTGVIGAAILKREGRKVLMKFQTSVTAQEVSRNVVEATLLAVGGLMLLSPGLLTDFLGLLFVLRPTRERLMLKINSKLKDRSGFRFEVRSF